MDALIQDVRYGILQLFRQRGSSLVAVLTLALAIGVTTAVFSVIDATMLRPLPYPDPEQLVEIGVAEIGPDGQVERPAESMADMRAWQTATDVVSAVAGWNSAFRGRIVDGPQPERLEVRYYTEDYLPMHGVTPMLGRGFTRADTEPSAPLVALLGYGYWQSRFAGREDVLGDTIRLDDEIATIVGVLPSSFHARVPVSAPLRIDPKEFSRRGTGRVSVHARLRPGVTIEQAEERLSARMASLPSVNPGVRQVRAIVTSRLEGAIGAYRTTVNIMSGAVALILIIGAVNVAGLLLARGAARQQELAVRASLGAGRGRLIRQLLTESVVLAIPAGALGVLLAWLSLDVIVGNLPLFLPANSPVTLNVKVLALTGALLVPTTLLFGLAPAIRLSRVRIGFVLARGSRQVGASLSRRGGQLLISAEVALAVILVTGAGLMIRSFIRISEVDLGFKPDGLLTMQVLPLDRTPAAHKAYYTALVQRLGTVPGVAAVGLVDNFALGSGSSGTSIVVDGKRAGTMIFEVLPGYFETIGVALRQGRLPADADYTSGLRAAVINESTARQLFSGRSPIGHQFIRAGQSWTVLGVIADLRHGGPLGRRSVGEPQVYFPLEPTKHDLNTAMTIVVRPSGDVPALGERLRQTAHAIGPRVLVERVQTADELFSQTVITPRRRTVLLGLLGGLGLLLALVGVFGMTAYAVTRRTAEIGVRMAFGARPGQVVRTILRDAAVPIVTGTVFGIGGAALASRIVESFLFETAPRDITTFIIVALTVCTAGCVAALLPALRAAKVDPVLSLRVE